MMGRIRVKDGVEIAYEVAGSGPAVVLLHGGAQTRGAWHQSGIVAAIRNRCTVIAMDIRGQGESDKPTDVESYAIDRLIDDVLEVADAAGVDRFSAWGYSYGGNIARYLPSRSDRVTSLVLIGIGFGAAAPSRFRDYALGLSSKWKPIIEAARRGSLDLGSMSEEDRALWQTGNVPLTVAQLTAITRWPPVAPEDVACPTLWIVGGANRDGMASVHEYQSRLAATPVCLLVIPDRTHAEELTALNEVLPSVLEFTLSTPECGRVR